MYFTSLIASSFRACLILITVSWGVAAGAQSTHLLSNRAGAHHIAVRDKAMSPLAYNGLGFFMGIRYRYSRELATDEIQFSYSSASIRNAFRDPVSYRQFTLQSFSFYRKINTDEGFQWGWSNHNTLHLRTNDNFTNNQKFFDYYTNFGPAFKFEKPFSLKQKTFHIDVTGSLQLLGFFLRPSFTKSELDGQQIPDLSRTQAFAQSIQWFYPGNAWQFMIRPALFYHLKGTNKLSIQYQYDFFHLNSMRPVTFSSGLWLVSLSTAI